MTGIAPDFLPLTRGVRSSLPAGSCGLEGSVNRCGNSAARNDGHDSSADDPMPPSEEVDDPAHDLTPSDLDVS